MENFFNNTDKKKLLVNIPHKHLDQMGTDNSNVMPNKDITASIKMQ